MKALRNVVLIVLVLVMVSGCGLFVTSNTYERMENRFKSLAIKHYNKNLKNKVIGVNNYTITLSSLEKAGYDIKGFKDPKTDKMCDVNSYVLISLKDKKDTSKYKTSVKLKCGSYITGEDTKK